MWRPGRARKMLQNMDSLILDTVDAENRSTHLEWMFQACTFIIKELCQNLKGVHPFQWSRASVQKIFLRCKYT